MNTFFQKCRLCLKLGDFCSIFEQDDSVKLSDMLMSFTNIKVIEGDGLTDRVCASCIENLSTAYMFKQLCEKNDIVIRTKFDNKENINNSPICMIHRNGPQENHENNLNQNNYNIDTLDAKDTSDDTESDIESIKCVYCEGHYNSSGIHTCHVTCSIENEESSDSDQTLVAADSESESFSANSTLEITNSEVSCVLCEDKYNNYDSYVDHINICTANVKLQYFVCSLCHEINTQKDDHLQHLSIFHFKRKGSNNSKVDGVDTVDQKVGGHMQRSRRQIGWSIEDIYQEIEPLENKVPNTPTSSPIKSFFARFGNESLSSTPRKVSFRKLIEDGKAKTSNYLPFKRYINTYKQKKKEALYSPVIPKSKRMSQMKSDPVSDSDYASPSSTSDDSWKLKQNLICACDKKIFMLSENLDNRSQLIPMIVALGGVVAENTKMEMLATHFIAVLPSDAYTGMMVCALATGKWLLQSSYVLDSFRGDSFLPESLYEWIKTPMILEMDNTCTELAKAASFWHRELQAPGKKRPFEGKQVVLIMKKKYRQYYQMVFRTLRAKAISYDPKTPGSCCSANYCFVDMRLIERVKLQFFASHNIPVFPYQYILIYLLNRGSVQDEHKYLLQHCKKITFKDTVDILNKTL